MKKFLVISFISFAIIFSATAQERNYQNAIGIRLGPSVPVIKSGISFQHFLANNNAVEGIVSFGDGLGLCALYEIHKTLPVNNLGWYIGFGGYVGASKLATNVGGAGIVGLQYDFNAQNLPLNLSLDWKPELNIVEKVGFEGSGVGFTARFTF